MKKSTAQLIFFLLCLPCASYAVFGELIKQVGPTKLAQCFLSRAMVTLSTEQRRRYQDLLAQLNSDIRYKKEIIAESYRHAPSSFYEMAEQDIRERYQERLIFLEAEKNHLERILREDT